MDKKILLLFTEKMFSENINLAIIDEQMQVAIQILINEGFCVLVSADGQKSFKYAENFVNIFRDENINITDNDMTNLSKENLIKNNNIVICFQREDIELANSINAHFVFIDICEKNVEEKEKNSMNLNAFNMKNLNAGKIIRKVEKLVNNDCNIKDKNILNSEKGNFQNNNAKENSSDEFEEYKKQVRRTIEQLINNNKLEEAKNIIREYESIIKDDVNIYSMKAVIAIMEGEIESAERILMEGLKIDTLNYELIYNLAYLYESQGKYVSAYSQYKKIIKIIDEEMIDEIKVKIEELEKIEVVREHMRNEVESAKQSPTITIETWAYNVEKYIEECAESVLNQSFTDFEWVIIDNGCTDRTSEILKQYSKKDKRVRVFRNEKNSFINDVSNNPNYIEYIKNIKSEYWCMLDSDDYLHPNFLKELYTIAKKHDADIAVGGTQMFREENQKITGTRCPPDLYTDDITRLGDIFPQIYGSFRPVWGKLFKVSVRYKILKYRTEYPSNKFSSGGDTIFCIASLSFAKSVVGVNKVLHYYRIRKTSNYHSEVNKNRYMDYRIIYNDSKKLLESWDKLNDTNLSFIGNVLYYSIKDCMDIAVSGINLSIEDRLGIITTILSDNFVSEVIIKNGLLTYLFMEIRNNLNLILENSKKSY